MTWQPPQPTQPGSVMPSVDVQGWVVRCDFALPAPVKPDDVVRLTRDTSNTWTLATDRQSLLLLPRHSVHYVRVHDATTTEKYTPGWAIALGVIGLFIFLIGIVFFFVKKERPSPASLLEVVTNDGRVLAVKCPNVVANEFRVGIGAY